MTNLVNCYSLRSYVFMGNSTTLVNYFGFYDNFNQLLGVLYIDTYFCYGNEPDFVYGSNLYSFNSTPIFNFKSINDSAYQDGYDKGFEDGSSSNTDSSYQQGYDDGYDAGYDDGYDVGYDDSTYEFNTNVLPIVKEQEYDKGYDEGFRIGSLGAGNNLNLTAFLKIYVLALVISLILLFLVVLNLVILFS